MCKTAHFSTRSVLARIDYLVGDNQRMDQTCTPCVKERSQNVTKSNDRLTRKQLKAIECTSARQVAIGFDHVEGIITHHSTKSGLSTIHVELGRCNKHLLHQLPRSGWSVGRAGLGAKATYPA